jgi:hypothetical protein
MTTSPPTPEIQIWHIDGFVPYARNPRKNDAVVDRICGSIREYGFVTSAMPSSMAALRRKSPSITVPSAFARIGTRFQSELFASLLEG